jgi:hypothetical protein
MRHYYYIGACQESTKNSNMLVVLWTKLFNEKGQHWLIKNRF